MLNSKPSDFQTKTVCGLSVLLHFQYARIIDCDTGRPPDCLVLAMTPLPFLHHPTASEDSWGAGLRRYFDMM